MGKAIKITVKKAPEGYDLGASKFFGTPTVPPAWDGDFYDDEIFFCQIKLSDITELAIDDFNASVEGYEQYHDAYLMEFSEADEDEICTRLFGVPSDWNYGGESPKLLMQYDPLDNEMGFLDTLDGFFYFFFVDDEKDFEKIILMEEYT